MAIPTTMPSAEEELRRRTAELEYHKQFEALLVSLCTSFINLPLDQLNPRLETALGEIGRFATVDRCFIYQLDPGGKTVSLTHEWSGPGTPSIRELVQGIDIKAFAWEMRELSAGRPLAFEDTSRMPAQASGTAAMYKQFGVRSAVTVPLGNDGRFRGVLGLSSIKNKLRWSEEHLALIQVFGEVLAGALERHATKSALATSQQRLQQVIRDQTEMILRWTPDGRVTFVNDAVCRFIGKDPDEVLGESFFGNIHSDDLVRFQEKLAALTPDQPLAVDEHRVLRPDGRVAWQQCVDRALFDSEGRLVEHQSVGRDITSLKLTEQELEHRLHFEELLLGLSTRLINPPRHARRQAIIDALREVGEFTGVDRCYLYFIEEETNHAELQYYWSSPHAPPVDEGLLRFPMSSLPWSVSEMESHVPFYTPSIDTIAEHAPELHKSLKAMNAKSMINVPMLSGERVMGYLGLGSHRTERAWSDQEVSLLRLVGEIMVSTIERGYSEEELEKSREKLRLTIEGVEEGVYDWDMETDQVVVSDYWLRSMGMPGGNNTLRKEVVSNLVHPDDRTVLNERRSRHFSGEAPVFEAEYRVKGAGGKYRWTLNRGRVIERNSQGDPIRMVGVERDITDAIKARTERRELESQLTHLGRVSAMGETVAAIAHEINQPLHAASTFNAAARSAIRSGNTQKAEQLSSQSSEQITRAADIIRRLRDYTRPRPSEIVLVDVNQLVSSSAEFVQGYNRNKKISLTLKLEDSLSPVSADAIQLQQVVVNLIQNGVDAINESGAVDGQIVAITSTVAGQVMIEISDNGADCPLSDPHEMFNAFVSTKPDGMGLGLSLCKTIIEAHNGIIEAHKNPTRGMTFVVRLPFAEAAPR